MSHESTSIRLNKEDRGNVAAVKSKMVKSGIPESNIGLSDVVRYALKKAAEK